MPSKHFVWITAASLLAGLGAAELIAPQEAAGDGSPPHWALNATVIEGCSCPMFCQCYFNTKPAGHVAEGSETAGDHHSSHGAKHFCRFNNAYRVNRGHFGKTVLDGVKFWLTGDIGDDFADGRMDWGELIIDQSATDEQRDAIVAIAGNGGPLFFLTFDSYAISERDIDTWRYDDDSAVATIDGGRTAEVRLRRSEGMTDEPIVMHNLKYWGAARNDGFLMMPNEVEAFREGPNAFEYKGTNGFMVTFEISSADVEKPSTSAY